MPVSTAGSFLVARRHKQPKCPWTDEWTDKSWPRGPVETYAVLKRKHISTEATTRMDLRMLLSEVKLNSHKKTDVGPFHEEGPKAVAFRETKSNGGRRPVVGEEGRTGAALCVGDGVSILQDEVLEVAVQVARQCERAKRHQTVHGQEGEGFRVYLTTETQKRI